MEGIFKVMGKGEFGQGENVEGGGVLGYYRKVWFC